MKTTELTTSGKRMAQHTQSKRHAASTQDAWPTLLGVALVAMIAITLVLPQWALHAQVILKPVAAKPVAAEAGVSVDAALEKQIAELEATLKKLKKGTPQFDLKEVELKRKQNELAAKVKASKLKNDANARAQAEKEEREKRITSGASLETNTDIDMLIDRARMYVEEENYSAACTLWQHILDGPTALTDRRPSTLAVRHLRDQQRGNFVYRPVRDLIETELAALPEEGLRDYRIKADVDARGLLGTIGPANEEAVLNRLVQQYFVSSVGDDAAYRLGCIRLDAYDFLGARELFQKVLQRHPDPSVPKIDLLIRATLASARAGDAHGARELAKQLEEYGGTSQGLMAALRQEVDRGARTDDSPTITDGWPMALGNSSRTGLMPGVPGAPIKGARLWAELPLYDAAFDFKVKQSINASNIRYGQSKAAANRASIVTRWEKGNWMPTSQVLLRDNKAFIKTHDSLRAIDLSTGRRAWDDVVQQGAGVPKGAQVYARSYYGNNVKSDAPSTREEVAMFGDRSAKSMALFGNTLVHIEERIWMGGQSAQWMMIVGGRQQSIAFSDVLCAVDADSGKIKWRFNTRNDKQREEDLRILAAPVKAGDLLILPVGKNGGELHLYGIDINTGKRTFDTFLCKGGQTNARRWEQAGIAMLGGEAYVATGEGVIFAIDAVNGQVKWATKYEQSKPASNSNTSRMIAMGMRGSVELPGWDDDVIIPHGNKLIVLPSDAEKLLCYSRITGKFLYSSPREDMRYCLGVRGNNLYVAGNKKVRCYDIPTGKVHDETIKEFGDCYARGALTANGIYMPTKEAIVRIDLETLDELGRMPIASKTKDPVGNLFTDGERLVASGLDRTYALVDGERKIIELTKRIKASDSGDARFERAFLQQVVGNHEEAVDDLRVAIRLLPDGTKRVEASRQLLISLLSRAAELKDSPDKAVPVFAEAEQVARPLGDLARVWLARGHFHDKRSEFDEALDMYLKAAQDTSSSLVTVKDKDGRVREARASHAGATAIRTMLRTRGNLVREVLLERGNQAMKPYRELATLERKLEQDPGAALPQMAEVQRLSAKLAELKSKFDQAKTQTKQWTELAGNYKIAVEMEKANNTGQLEELEAELAQANATLAKSIDEEKELSRELGIAKQQIEITRKQQTDTLIRLNELKTDRVKHASKLLRIAAMFPDIDISMEAQLLAADHLLAGDHFERGELVLRNLAGVADRRHAASAIAAMAQSYEDKGWKRQARLEWDRLMNSFVDQRIRFNGEDKDVVKVARGRIEALKAEATPSFRQMPSPPLKQLWGDPVSGRYYLIETTALETSQFLEDHVLLLNTSRRKLVCRNIATGEDLWQHSLSNTNVSGSSSSNGRLIKYNDYVFPGGRLMSDGHVGIMWSSKSVSAIGLSSGKTLWETKPFSADANTNSWYYPYDDPIGPVDVGNGLLVEQGMSAKRGVEQVRATDLATGSVRWVADFEGESIMGVKAAGGYVNVFLSNGRSASYFSDVVICDLESGQRLGTVKLGNRSRYYPFTWTRFGMMSVESSSATLYELPSGKKKWTTSLTGKVRTSTSYMRARMIDDENCFIMAQGLHIINMRGGKIKMSAGDVSMGKYLNDGSISPDGKEIYVFGYTYDSKAKTNSRQMTIIDAKNGKKKISAPIGPYTSSTRDADRIAGAGDLVPIVMREAPLVKAGVRRISNNYELAFFRKSDGKRMDLKLPRGGNQFDGEVFPIVRGNVLLLMSSRGISAYVTDESVKDYKLKEYVAPKEPTGDKSSKADEKDGKQNAKAPQVRPVPAIQIAPARIQIRRGAAPVRPAPAKPAPAKPKQDSQDAKNSKDSKDAKKEQPSR